MEVTASKISSANNVADPLIIIEIMPKQDEKIISIVTKLQDLWLMAATNYWTPVIINRVITTSSVEIPKRKLAELNLSFLL